MEFQILMMRHIKLRNIFIVATLCLSLHACEEVIDIDLRSRTPEMVVEGVIARDSTCRIRLSMTTDYFDNVEEVPVTDADVTLMANNGEEETLIHTGYGYYSGSTINGTTGVTYTLIIKTGGKEITGHTYLPEPVEIKSIEGIPAPFGRPGDDPVYILEVKFSDNPETENYYMLRFFRNDTVMTDIISLASNAYNSSGTMEYSEWRYDYSQGDSAIVEVYSIDSDLYSYFSMLNEVTSFGINFSTPYNPRSNLTGNALGYFGSWSFVRDSTVIR